MLLATLLISGVACAQSLPRLDNMTPARSLVPSIFISPAKQPCVHPTEPFDIDDYNGPLNKVVARFSQRLEAPLSIFRATRTIFAHARFPLQINSTCS